MPPIQKLQRIWVWSDVFLLIPTLLPIRVTQENQGVAPGSTAKTLRDTRAAALWWWVAECAFSSRCAGNFCALGAADTASARVIRSLGLLAVLLGQLKEISLFPHPPGLQGAKDEMTRQRNGSKGSWGYPPLPAQAGAPTLFQTSPVLPPARNWALLTTMPSVPRGHGGGVLMCLCGFLLLPRVYRELHNENGEIGNAFWPN